MTDFLSRYPRYPADYTDLTALIETTVLPGHTPPTPPLTPTSTIATIGSCFSRHIAENLGRRGLNVQKLEMAEVFTTPALVHFALKANQPAGVDCLIITLGIGDGPYTALVSKIWGILRLAKLANVQHTIVTVSPATLNRSANPSAVVADCLSKCLLRSAVDEALRQWNSPTVRYWPSFEMIRWLGPHLPRSVYGGTDGICRHVDMDLVGIIMELWWKYWVRA